MDEMNPSPESIIRVATGTWAAAVLSAAVDNEVFTLIDGGKDTSEAIAGAARSSPRGTQAILDGLVGLGFLTVESGRYSNTPDVSMFLVKDRPAYIGDWIGFHTADMAEWSRFGEVVRTGEPAFGDISEVRDLDALALALAPLSIPSVQMSSQRLSIAEAGPISILDVGGGSGVFSAFWLSMNPEARSTQIDTDYVNKAARGYVEGFGVDDRFTTIDGDAVSLDWGSGEFDIGVFSHVAHAIGPEENMEAFVKFRRALKPGGTLLVVDFVLADDRSGPPMGLLFHVNMLIRTPRGAAWREADYRAWLTGAGFTDITIDTSVPPVGLIYAR